jgi:hypothetical protein
LRLSAGKINLFEDAMSNLVSIMMEQEMKRIIIIGGAVTPAFDDEVFNFRQKFLSFILNLAGKNMIEIKKKECAVLAQSGLDWTIVRPQYLPALKKLLRWDGYSSVSQTVSVPTKYTVFLLYTNSL